MPAKRKPSVQARAPKRPSRKPAKRMPRNTLAIKEFKTLDRWFVYLAKTLAQCEHEQPFIYSLLQQLYCTGFGSGAVACRKVFTDWKPPSDATSALEQLEEIDPVQPGNVRYPCTRAPRQSKQLTALSNLDNTGPHALPHL